MHITKHQSSLRNASFLYPTQRSTAIIWALAHIGVFAQGCGTKASSAWFTKLSRSIAVSAQ